MTYLIIDGGRVGDRAELFETFSKHLDLPEYMGRNLDALHEVILEDVLPKDSLTIVIKDYAQMKEKLGRLGVGLSHMLTDASEEDSRLTLIIGE